MSTFSIPLAQLAERLKLDVETVVRSSTQSVFAAVVARSPVDTGRFRANWNVSYSSIDTSITESTDTGRANAEVARVALLPVGGVTYLSNSLPYAQRLEFGHSGQAPNGMVRLAAVEFSDYVNQGVRSL